MAKQVKFLDLENNAEMGGIELDSGDIICCCCGGLFEKSEEGILWKKLNEYRIWADLSPKICIENESDRFKRFKKGTIHHIYSQKNEGEF